MGAPGEELRATRIDGSSGDRWGQLWHAFFAVTLLAPSVLAAASAATPLRAAVVLGTAVVFGAWHWWLAIRHHQWEGRAPMLVWFAGALVFTGVLLGMDARFVFLVYGLYPQVFWLLGRYAVPGAVLLTLVVFWRSGVLLSGPVRAWAPTVAGSVVLAVMVGMFVTTLVRQNAARKAALEQLEATRAHLAATARRAGVLEERERMARELHDTVAQGFTGIVMQLEACDQVLGEQPERAREYLARARAGARDSLAELRRAARAMRPSALDRAGLPEALGAVTRQWAEESGTPATATCEGVPRPLDPEQEAALLRTGQEALANVAKHARASSVQVRLCYLPDAVELSVADDGLGFDTAQAGGGDGAGLLGIRERIAALGGDVVVGSVPGRGTTVRARLALR